MPRSRQLSDRPNRSQFPCRRRSEDQYLARRGFFESLEPRLVLSFSALGDVGGVPLSNTNMSSPTDPDLAPLPDHVANEILIGLEGRALGAFRAHGAAAALASAGLSQYGLHSPRVLLDAANDLAIYWKLPETQDLASVIKDISQRPGVAFAEPNFTYTTALTPTDPLFSDLYGLNNTGQAGGTVDADIDAPEAWDITTGSHQVVVGVIDTGVDYTHPDLYRNIWINQNEIPSELMITDSDDDGQITFVDLNAGVNDGLISDINHTGFIDAGDILNDPDWADGVDQDRNGYVDDLIGWDFVNDDNNPFDDNIHGTHVSGTIGAMANNGIGVAGVAWDVQIIPLKFLNSGGGGTTDGAVAAVNYAAQTNARLTSNSWGGGGYSVTLLSAIANANQLFVAAAGNYNTNTDTSPFYPASYDLDNIISVAATDRNDAKADFSNWGATTVDLAAPGVDTLSTVPGGGYGNLSGTSMATPHVSGTAALVWSMTENADWTTVRQALLDGADANTAFAVGGANPIATGGRLNAVERSSNSG